MEEEIQILRTGEERRDSCASQSNGCCFDPAVREQVFACGATQTEHFIQPMQPEFYRRFKAPDALEQRAEGEREEDWDDEKAAGWYESATVGSAVQPAGCSENPSMARNRNRTHVVAPRKRPRVGRKAQRETGLKRFTTALLRAIASREKSRR